MKQENEKADRAAKLNGGDAMHWAKNRHILNNVLDSIGHTPMIHLSAVSDIQPKFA